MRIQAAVWAAATALVLTTTPGGASASPIAPPFDPESGSTGPGQGPQHRAERAEAALEQARTIFADRRAAARGRGTEAMPEPAAHASLVLRDLAVGLDDLDRDDQQIARRILARPSDNGGDALPGLGTVEYDGPSVDTCTVTGSTELDVCIHWVPDQASPHAPPALDQDADGDGVPDSVEANQQVFSRVWSTIVDDLGYRPPLDDSGASNPGPDGRTDIYIAELGDLAGLLFGYCATEPVEGSTRGFPAYCVVDNDFAEFPGDPVDNLKVTAAHEFFHAVQAGYSGFVDHWLAEGTAMWMEDEVYDGVNAYTYYERDSPLSTPGAPLDFAPAQDLWVYGSWIWWRYLAERYGPRRTSDPLIVRDVWTRLGNGQGSLTATRRAVSARGEVFGQVFADFGATNRIARRWYEEGRLYSNSPVAGVFRVSRARPALGWRQGRLYHLSNMHALVRPGRGLAGRWFLRFRLDLPPKARGSQATVVVTRRDGRTRWYRPRLDRRGDAVFAVPFNKRVISSAALTFTNASTRITSCGSGTVWSCSGVARDDDLPFRFRLRAFRR